MSASPSRAASPCRSTNPAVGVTSLEALDWLVPETGGVLGVLAAKRRPPERTWWYQRHRGEGRGVEEPGEAFDATASRHRAQWPPKLAPSYGQVGGFPRKPVWVWTIPAAPRASRGSTICGPPVTGDLPAAAPHLCSRARRHAHAPDHAPGRADERSSRFAPEDAAALSRHPWPVVRRRLDDSGLRRHGSSRPEAIAQWWRCEASEQVAFASCAGSRATDAELLTIATDPASRQTGLGLGHMIFARARHRSRSNRGLERWVLEVARNNLPCDRPLQIVEGFVEIGCQESLLSYAEGRASGCAGHVPARLGPVSGHGRRPDPHMCHQTSRLTGDRAHVSASKEVSRDRTDVVSRRVCA